MGNAYIDEPVQPGDTPLYSWEAMETVGKMSGGIDVLTTFTTDGRKGYTVRFQDIRRAAGFHDLVRADVFSVELSDPVAKFHVPVAVNVVLLDPKRDNWPAWHRERCSGCIVCQVS